MQPNWANLVASGRAKDIGVPWNDDEVYAIYSLKIPVSYVRQGIVTLDEYTAELERESKEGKRIDRMSKDELMAKAAEMKLKFTPDATVGALVKLVKLAQEKATAKVKMAKGVAKAVEEESTFRRKHSAKASLDQKEAVEEEAESRAKKQKT